MNDLFGSLISLCGLLCLLPMVVFFLPGFVFGRAYERGYRIRSPLGRRAVTPSTAPARKIDPGYATRIARETKPPSS